MSKAPLSASFFRTDWSGEWNTWSNLGLYFREGGLKISSPEPDLQLVDVPGRDAPLDLTEALLDGYVHYKTRTITLQLLAVHKPHVSYLQWETLFSDLRTATHGRRLRCILSNDADNYWEGRWKVDCEQISRNVAYITITGICDPYKVNMTTGEKLL